MKTYEARVSREGKWWMIAIPEIDGLTQARRVDEVEQMARECVAVTLDVPLSEVAVDVRTLSLEGTDLVATAARLEELRQAAKDAERTSMAASRAFAHQMASKAVPVRDIGALMGVSPQRVSQLIQEYEKTDESAATTT